MHLLKSTILIVIVAVCAAFTVQPAKADLFSFDLTIGNTAISPFPGPYAHVEVDRTSISTATITFTSLTSGTNIYLMGDGATAAVNVSGAFTLGAISGSNSGTGFTPGPFSDGGAGNVSQFGVFNLTINSFDGFTHSSDFVSFDLTGGNWADAASVLTANNNGFLAAAHIFVTTTVGGVNAKNGAIATGFAGNGGGTLPDSGTTAMLLGAALTGLGVMRRYLKR